MMFDGCRPRVFAGMIVRGTFEGAIETVLEGGGCGGKL